MRIGVFDSGLGGLSILREIRRLLPEYDYLYLGDNARAPYGTRSFDVIYDYTWQAVQYLFANDCALVILACNTASAKALRNIQQHDLSAIWQRDGHDYRRVLGVIRPTVEALSIHPSQTGHVGILATQGTVTSGSYVIELQKQNPNLTVTQQACPMWVPLIENGEKDTPATDYFVDKYLTQLFHADEQIDTLLLGCTHYPLIERQIRAWLTQHQLATTIVSQGELVAHSLQSYLGRHADLQQRCAQHGECQFLTTESPARFAEGAAMFLGEPVTATHVEI